MAKKPPPSMKQRAFALAVFLLTAAVFGYVMSRPWVRNVRDETYVASPDETLSLIGPAGAPGQPLVSLLGPVGRNMIVRADHAALDADAPMRLAGAVSARVGAGPQKLAWQVREGGPSRGVVAVRLAQEGQGAALTLTPGGTATAPEVTFNSANARLRLNLVGAVTDEEDGAPPPRGDLVVYKPGDPAMEALRVELPLGGALPLPLTTAAGSGATVRYADTAAGEAIYETGTGLAVAAIRVRSDVGPDRFAACGARPGISWTGSDVAKLRCQPLLKVSRITVNADGVSLKVRGSGFVAKEGKSTNFPVQNFKENPAIAGLLSAAMAALGGWTLKTVFAPLPKPAAPRSARPRRRRAAAGGGEAETPVD